MRFTMDPTRGHLFLISNLTIAESNKPSDAWWRKESAKGNSAGEMSKI